MEKKQRTVALSNFTRNINSLYKLLDQAAPDSLVTPQFQKLKGCWEKLEIAHDLFIGVTEIEIETEKDGLAYIDGPNEQFNAAMERYSSYLKTSKETEEGRLKQKVVDDRAVEEVNRKKLEEQTKAEEIEVKKQELKLKFDSAVAELTLAIHAFKRKNLTLKDSVGDASVGYKQKEWQEVTDEFGVLRKQFIKVAGIDPKEDLSPMNKLFLEDVEVVFLESKKWMMSELKNTSEDKEIEVKKTKDSAAKKEAVGLPEFKGEEKESPYLRYPIWKKQWDVLIVEYAEQFRPGLLYKNLDDFARNRFAGYEDNYEEAMKRLDAFFGDPSKVVSHVMKEVKSPKDILDGDYKSLLSYSSILENNYNRLNALGFEHELSNTSTMGDILRKFPRPVSEKWVEHLSIQSTSIKSKPFPEFIVWLISQKDIWERMSVVDTKVNSRSVNTYYGDHSSESFKCYGCGEVGHKRMNCPKREEKQDARRPKKAPKVKKYWCAYHKGDTSRRCSSVNCQELRKMEDVDKRIQLLIENKDCKHCVGDHLPADCTRKERKCGGGKENRGCERDHCIHELFCTTAKVCYSVQQVHTVNSDQSEGVLLLIMNVRGIKRSFSASVFWDLGSSSNFVRESYAKKCKFRGRQETLSVTTLGGVTTDFHTVTTYKCSIRSVNGEIYNFEAYGMNSITGALTTIKGDVIRKLFPNLDQQTILNLKRTTVDFLIGMQHPSWHPERAECAKDGSGDLWLYRGRFGTCVGGRHSLIKEETRKSQSLFVVNHIYHVDVRSSHDSISHNLEFCPKRVLAYEDLSGDTGSCKKTDPVMNQSMQIESSSIVEDHGISFVDENKSSSVLRIDDQSSFCAVCLATKTSVINEQEMFFQLESLGLAIEPRCGGCKCTRCPIPGSKYSFKEQKEYDIIKNSLFYNEEEGRWYVWYPWKHPRSVLPRNEKAAYQGLMALEKRLFKDPDPELAPDFCNQIRDMVDRGNSTILTEEELAAWDQEDKDFYYLSLVGVKGKKKWLRVCCNASKSHGKSMSMNDCLYKGPDRFMNNLLSVLLGFRNGRVGGVADLSKFHNQVSLFPEDIHMQRFLWREMKTDEKPRTYAIKVNNFGVRPANCIATLALHKSADLFEEIYPLASRDIKEQTYIDDELVAAESREDLIQKTKRMDEITKHAGMPNKGWTLSGDIASGIEIGKNEDELEEKVLGLSWEPESDTFKFRAKLKLKMLDEECDLKEIVIDTNTDLDKYSQVIVLTRRILLSNVSKIFDPVGFLCPITLESKLLLRETWRGSESGWDDPLSNEQKFRWLKFLKQLLDLNRVQVPRSLWPQKDIVGLPILVIFSDGSISAFGAAAYARWKLKDGSYWSCLIMSKSKIAPKRIVSIPRMELSGAVAGNRMKNFIQKETNLIFSKVYHLVDSSTVLGYVHKESGIFGPYEGIRIAEIQSSNDFKDGKLEGWAWVPGHHNPADWCTKPRVVQDLIDSDFFYAGPSFLKEEEEDWPIKFTYRTDKLEGEIDGRKRAVCNMVVNAGCPDVFSSLFLRSSSWNKLVRVVAWILRLCEPIKRRPSGPLHCDEIKRSKLLLVKEVQKEINEDLTKAEKFGKGRYRKLAPLKDKDGVWRVGSRLRNLVPFTDDAQMPKILPTKHKMTLLIMRSVHNFSHSGLDGTLSRFHAKGYWTVRAGHLAKYVKKQCIDCRKMSKISISQPLGEFSSDQLNSPMAWGFCQLDLFGPYKCRGDVNPRTSKKVWAMVIEDVNSGAVHLDIVSDYSTDAVLLTLRRF